MFQYCSNTSLKVFGVVSAKGGEIFLHEILQISEQETKNANQYFKNDNDITLKVLHMQMKHTAY